MDLLGCCAERGNLVFSVKHKWAKSKPMPQIERESKTGYPNRSLFFCFTNKIAVRSLCRSICFFFFLDFLYLTVEYQQEDHRHYKGERHCYGHIEPNAVKSQGIKREDQDHWANKCAEDRDRGGEKRSVNRGHIALGREANSLQKLCRRIDHKRSDRHLHKFGGIVFGKKPNKRFRYSKHQNG